MITFSGLATGMDTDALIKGLVQAERTPITRLEATTKQLTTRADKWRTLRTRLTDLHTAAKALATPSAAAPTKITSSDSAVLSATSIGGATLGRFDVSVERLATSARIYSDPFAASDQPGALGTGTLSIGVGSATPVEITIDASDTLDSVVSKINASGAGVTAGVLFDGSAYRLQINGNQTGAANALTLGESGSVALGVSKPANVRQEAQDARLVVDGFTVTSASNTVTGALPGVSLTLKAPSPAGTTQRVEVTRDPDALEQNLDKLVEAYNAVARFVQTESAFTGTAKGPESLVGDAGLRSVQSRLRTALGDEVEGATGRYTTLASLGFKTGVDGQITVDKAKLRAAIADDADAVAGLLGRAPSGVMPRLISTLDELNDATTGIPAQRITSIDGRKKGIAEQIDRLERRMEAYEAGLRAQFTALEKLVSGLQNQGAQITSVLSQLSNNKNT